MLVFGRGAERIGKWLRKVRLMNYTMSLMELDQMMDPAEIPRYLLQPMLQFPEASPDWLRRSADEYTDCVERFSFLRGHAVTHLTNALYNTYVSKLDKNMLDAVLHVNYTRMVERMFMLFSYAETRSKFARLRSLILETFTGTIKSLDLLVEYMITYQRRVTLLTTVTFLSLNTLLELIPMSETEQRLSAGAA